MRNPKDEKEPRDKGAAGGKNASGSAWRGFIDLPLSAEDKGRLRGAELPPDDLLGVIDVLVQQGYKLSVTYDSAHGAVVASVTGVGGVCPNKGYTLSARSSAIPMALTVLWYKCHVLAEDGVWENVSENRFGDELL